MPCEAIQDELNKLRSEKEDLSLELQGLPTSDQDHGSGAKGGAGLKKAIEALDQEISVKERQLTQCLVAAGIGVPASRTRFRPETDGFLFSNSWTWDATEKATLQQLITDALPAVEAALWPILGPALDLVFLGIPVPFNFIAEAIAISSINDKIADAVTDAITTQDNGHYGLCGGMTFAALDYWRKGWVVPQGIGPNDQPQRTTPEGSVLRDYLWTRLINSLEDNAVTFLSWMSTLHSEDVNGEKILNENTFDEIVQLRAKILKGHPVPIGLVGTTNNPFHNHQVLCYGFQEHNSQEKISLFVYDNNLPNKEAVITLDMTGSTLKTVRDDTRSDPGGPNDRGPLRGLFRTVYRPVEPPKALVVRKGLSVNPSSAGARQQLDVRYTAANVGYNTAAPMRLLIRPDHEPLVGGETTASPIPKGGERQASAALTFEEAGDHHVAAAADLGYFGPNQIHVVKVLPPETASQAASVTVPIFSGMPFWRWCQQCQGLFWAGNPRDALERRRNGANVDGFCPAGGGHVQTGSGNYSLVVESPKALGQKNWRHCNKCHGLFFGGDVAKSRCPAPAGGPHDMTGSGSFTIQQNVPTGGQNNWRWCRKCQGMHFAGNSTEGVCPAGGTHIHEGSGDYRIFQI